MPGAYSRVKVWSSGEILTAADLNSEFNNEINNAVPASIDDYSTSLGQMQTQTDPYPAASASQAATLAGELERIRYQIANLQGTTYWYEDPASTIATLAQPNLGLHIGLEFEGNKGGASTTTDVLKKLVNQGAIINAASYSTADVATADFDSTNKKFGSYSYILASGNILSFPGQHGNPIKGTLSAWFRNLAAGDYIGYNPLLGVEVFLSGTGLLSTKITEKIAATESTKSTSAVAGSVSRAGDTTFRNVIAQWRCNDENGAGTDLLGQYYEGAAEGTQISSDNLDINEGDGGYWFIGAKRNDPTWDHFYAASGLPSAHSDAWTKTGTFTESATSGVLNIAASSLTGNQFYAKSNNIDLDGMTIEFKMRVNSIRNRGAAIEDNFVMLVRDDSKNRGIILSFDKTSVSVINSTGVTTGSSEADISVDTSQWHVYRITSTASGANIACKFYIDGVNVYSYNNNTSDTTAADTIFFGGTNSSSYSFDVDIEYFKYESNGTNTVYPPVAASSQGNIDSFGIASQIASSAIISQIQSSRISDVFGESPTHGVYLPNRIRTFVNTQSTVTSATLVILEAPLTYYVAGDGVTEFLFSYTCSFTHSSATAISWLGISVNDDLNNGSTTPFAGGGATFITNSTTNPGIVVTATRSLILPIGLNTVSVYAATSSGTLTKFSAVEATYERSIVKRKDLS